MASQMADCLMDTVSANITEGDYIFRASGFHVTFDGFTALYEEATDDKQKKETALPPLEVNQDLKQMCIRDRHDTTAEAKNTTTQCGNRGKNGRTWVVGLGRV